ncbi:hypothetical protein EYF80_053360 [Liparis tanakae]|uniref:Uncharacterized protein n=1 Tax=Liparis tanakae TaxID=230148 RepID=A0A4Z2F6H6_9TELE|nr:hypothetical protein EYF80_053360 [Liparis tanakae]
MGFPLVACLVTSARQVTYLFDCIQQPLQQVLSLGVTLLSACRAELPAHVDPGSGSRALPKSTSAVTGPWIQTPVSRPTLLRRRGRVQRADNGRHVSPRHFNNKSFWAPGLVSVNPTPGTGSSWTEL